MNSDVGSLIGVAGQVDETAARGLASSLRRIWILTMKTDPANLHDDLELCRRWFDPVAQGQRLRRELAQLEKLPEDLAIPGDPFTLAVGDRKCVITPEGRCALDLLEQLPIDAAVWFIDKSQEAYYDRVLARLYRKWSRHRIDSVIALLEGTNKPLQIPAAGVVIALLVNGSVGEERAMVRFASTRPRQLVDEAFFAAVNAFADILAPSRRGSRSSTLISGWMLYEVRRRVGDGLVVEDFGGNKDGKVWIKAGQEASIVDIIARDLARGHRPKVTVEVLEAAFDALVSELRKQLPSLAGFGLSHEQPTETRRLKARLLESLSKNLDLPS